MKIDEIVSFLRHYEGEPVTLMEICGTHTAAISENGIPSMLSPSIRLITGPGCPVCVTVSAYIDRLIELALTPDTVVVSFGDLLRVKGSDGRCLRTAQAEGAEVKMVYSPFEMLDMAVESPQITFVFAAVGFETTAPLYALLIKEANARNIDNIRLLSALKTMPAAVERLSADADASGITGFIAPGHVCTVMGADIFRPIAERYDLPFAVAGFSGESLLAAIYALVKLRGKGRVVNLYPEAVDAKGTGQTEALLDEYFEPCSAAWRGMGVIEKSGLRLRDQYARFDIGGRSVISDALPKGCHCGEVISGRRPPDRCPLYGKVCTPENPIGACMVSAEGACFHYYINRRASKDAH